MGLVPGFRRVPPPGPLPESDPVLVAALRDEIRRDGPITFARFMEVALYDPERGYYAGESARPGREGDFLTAPETHPIFGHVLARALTAAWEAMGRPDPFTLIEHAAGSGTLALAIVDGLRRDGAALLDALRYVPVEIVDRRRDELVARLIDARLGDRLIAAADPARAPAEPARAEAVRDAPPHDEPPRDEPSGEKPTRAGPTAADRPIVGCILANELVDALPFHRVELRDGVLREVLVGWDDARADFVDVPSEPSTPALATRLRDEGVELAESQRAEVRLADEAWIAAAAAPLERGVALVLDYGHEARDLYGPARRGGTLRTYLRHMVASDPYGRVGRQDITAHVDLTALVRGGERAGLTHLGTARQSSFLLGSGLSDLLTAIQRDPATTLGEYTAVRSAVVRMLDPLATGRFAVVGFGRGVPPDVLPGLAWRLPT